MKLINFNNSILTNDESRIEFDDSTKLSVDLQLTEDKVNDRIYTVKDSQNKRSIPVIKNK